MESLLEVKPKHIYVAIDGPRSHIPSEKQLVSECYEIFTQLPWQASVNFLKRDKNLGCRESVSSAITWFFNQVEQGIVLEDDCIPSEDFFSYAETLLEKYKNDDRVMAISGDNLISYDPGIGSYFFSRYCHIWGWASWRRAWKFYDVKMTYWPQDRESGLLETLFSNRREVEYWKNIFDRTHAGKIDTWDFQWIHTIFRKSGMCIVPKVNLVRNIGFDERATHTKHDMNLSLQAMDLPSPLAHPTEIKICEKFDEIESKRFFRAHPQYMSLMKKSLRKLKDLVYQS